MSTYSYIFNTTQNLALSAFVPLKSYVARYISRIRDALLLVDDHPDFKIESSKGKMLSLSEAKGDMEAYIKLTGSGFNLCG